MSDSVGSFVQQLTNPKVVNPLAAVQAGNEAANSYYNVQQQRAKQALGEAYQGAIGPDGRIDPLKLNQNIANSPLAAMAAQSGVESSQKLQQDQFVLNSAQRAKLNDVVTSALQIRDPAQRADYLSRAGADLISSGVVPADRVVAGFMHMPTDPAGQEAYLRGLQYQTYSPEQKQGLTTGEPFRYTNPQGGISAGTMNTGTGNITPGQGAVGQGAPPGTTVDAMVQTPKGPVKVTLPYNTVFGGQGGATTAPSGGSAAPPGAPPPPPGTTVRPAAPAPSAAGPGDTSAAPGGAAGWDAAGGGRTGAAMPAAGATAAPAVPASAPAATTTAPAPRSTAAAPAVSSPLISTPAGPAVVSGTVPGVAESLNATGTASAAQGVDLTKRADQAPVNKATYDTMLGEMSRFRAMGPGTAREAAINAALQKWTGFHLTMNPEDVASAEGFAKAAKQLIAQQLASIGGTDSRQELYMGATPGLELTKLGNTEILHLLKGNEDAIQAKSRAWQQWLRNGNTPDSYGQFQDDFNFHFDPRVFQQRYMGPQEIARLKSTMVDKNGNLTGEGRKFQEDVTYARANGWIP